MHRSVKVGLGARRLQECGVLASSSDLREVPALASAHRTAQVRCLILSGLHSFIGQMRITGLLDAELEEKCSTCNAYNGA